MNKSVSIVLFATLASNVAADDIQRYLEGNFAAAILLSDSNTLSLGFKDFDPNEIVDSDANIGTDESLALRKQLQAYAIPYTLKLPTLSLATDQTLKQRLTLKASYLRVQQNLELDDDPINLADTNKEEVYGLSANYWTKYAITDRWSINTGLGLSTLYYRNTFRYRSPVGQLLKEELDGVLLNTDAWAVTLQPHIDLYYTKPTNWGRWELLSELNYFYGKGWGEANNGNLGNPEGWYWMNGARVFYDFAQLSGYKQTLMANIRQVNLGSALKQTFGGSDYFEYGVGWLVSPPFWKEYIDNIGIGININQGSVLQGGTILLLINEE